MSQASNKTLDQEFTGLRDVFWPLHKHELRKFWPMALMIFFFVFISTILRDLKDSLIILAPGGGAEDIAYLKHYSGMPSAILFIFIFFIMANRLSYEKLFYAVTVPFLIFFISFAWIFYPYQSDLHMSLETIQRLQAKYPAFNPILPLIKNWTFSLFFILSELWILIIPSMLFWNFANHIIHFKQAKRLYGLFGIIFYCSFIVSPSLIYCCTQYVKSLSGQVDTWGINLRLQLTLAFGAGITILALCRHLYKNVLSEEENSFQTQPLKLSIIESFNHIFKSPHLRLILGIILAHGIVHTLIQNIWKSQLRKCFPDPNEYMNFIGHSSLWTSIAMLLIMILANILLNRLSWKKSAFLMPLIMFALAAVFFSAVLYSNAVPEASGITFLMTSVMIGQFQNMMFMAIKYTLFDTNRQMAYIPLDSDLKVKGQAAIEIIGHKISLSIGSLILILLMSYSGETFMDAIYSSGIIIFLMILGWLYCVAKLGNRIEKSTKETSNSLAS